MPKNKKKRKNKTGSDHSATNIQVPEEMDVDRSSSREEGTTLPETTVPCELVQQNIEETVTTQSEPLQKKTTTDSTSVTESLDELDLKKETNKALVPLAIKKPKGKFGKKIDLIANYFPLKCKINSIFHYDIVIEYLKRNDNIDVDPKKQKGKVIFTQASTSKEDIKKGVGHIEHQQKRRPGKELCRKIIWKLFNEIAFKSHKYVYDGQKMLYTTDELPISNKKEGDKFIVQLKENDDERNYRVIIKPVAKNDHSNVIDMNLMKSVGLYRNYSEVHQEAIMALDTVMCHRNPKEKKIKNQIELFFSQIQVGRSFFCLNAIKNDVGLGFELWHGYNQSVRPTEKEPAAVVVNFAAKPFFKPQNILDFSSEFLNKDITVLPSLQESDIKKLSEVLYKAKIQVTHLPYTRKYTVMFLTNTSAKETFDDIKGERISIASYFRETYPHRQLSFSNLPCLVMTNKSKLPMEVCQLVPNQPKFGKIPSEVTKNLIFKTAIPPRERFQKIADSSRLIVSKEISGQHMQDFKLSMSLNFMEFQGRVLEAPKLLYDGNKRFPIVTPDNCGRWHIDNNKFIKPVQDDFSWVLINFADCRQSDLNEFVQVLSTSAHRLGMNMGNCTCILNYRKESEIFKALNISKEKGANLIIIVLPKKDKDATKYYEEIKSLAEPEMNIITQCLKVTTIMDIMRNLEERPHLGQQKVNNILNKINVKLGGINHKLNQPLEIFKQPFIVFGADAVHSPRGYNRPSIASVVGSLDCHAARYAVTSRIQYPENKEKLSQEIILELDSMIEDLLKAFKSTVSRRLEKILFFRDGVSEGQFETILQTELQLIKKACNAILGYEPAITLIIVQKRHQTRLRPTNLNDGIGRGKNVPCGTTVDTDIVHPRYFEFYLCSHEGIQGTSKPARYIVLHDDNNFSSDDLQKICYYLCHLYVKCNRSISIPAPVQYADLSCKRAKIYVDNYLDKQNMQTCPQNKDEKIQLPSDIVKKVTGMKDCATMYFI